MNVQSVRIVALILTRLSILCSWKPVFCESYNLSHRKAEVEEIFQREPGDVFDGIAGLLGVSTWFPRDLTNYKLEKTRKNIRLYRKVE